MKTFPRFIAGSLALLAVPALAAEQASQQFDLVCGTRDAPPRPMFRVDLVAGEWCRSECRSVEKIASITSGLIVLKDERVELPHRTFNRIEVNRVTGEARDQFKNRIADWDSRYACTSAPFSGFPIARRKF